MDLEANSIPGTPFDINEHVNGTFVITSDWITRDPFGKHKFSLQCT